MANAKGQYPIADDGLVKTKATTERPASGKVRVRGPRTDWSACRQSAIHEIGEAYGWMPPENLRCTKDGKLLPRQTPQDSLGDQTRAGERKTGKKSKERQIAEVGNVIFTRAESWAECDRDFASMSMEMVFKTKNGDVVGGYLVGPDGRKCSFSKCGHSFSALEKQFRTPSPADAACTNEYELEPFEYHDDFTLEEAKKRLFPVFTDAMNHRDWPQLILDIHTHGMRLERSGGGLVVKFNDGYDTIKCSDISNKFSISRLEKVLGSCPLPKATPASLTPLTLLIRDAEALLKKHVAQGHGLDWIEPDLNKINISIEERSFSSDVGKKQVYYAFVRGDISVPISDIAKTAEGKPVYTMLSLQRLDTQDVELPLLNHITESKNQPDEKHRRYSIGSDSYETYQQEGKHAKEFRVDNLSFFASVVKFLKLKNMESDYVYKDSQGIYQCQFNVGDLPCSQQVFPM